MNEINALVFELDMKYRKHILGIIQIIYYVTLKHLFT